MGCIGWIDYVDLSDVLSCCAMSDLAIRGGDWSGAVKESSAEVSFRVERLASLG